MPSDAPLIEFWDTCTPVFRSLVSNLLREPDRSILIDDEYVLLNDENYHELILSHQILRPHATTFATLLSKPLTSLSATFLKDTLAATTFLLKEAERNVNTLQYALQGRRWRSAYSYTASLVAVAILALLIRDDCDCIREYGKDTEQSIEALKLDKSRTGNWEWQNVIDHLDFALIKTGGWPITTFIHELLELLDRELLPLVDATHIHHIDWNNSDDRWSNSCRKAPALRYPGKETDCPGIFPWRKIYFEGKPIKLTGIMEHWPVFDIPSTDEPSSSGCDIKTGRKSKWSSLPYLLSKTLNGRRIVPVEVGNTYTDPDLRQIIMKFGDYMNTYVLSNPNVSGEQGEEGVFGYLAQHNLLTQIPSLRNDVCVPECIKYTTSTAEGSEEEEEDEPKVTVNAWLGPANTITPLHTDNYHNIFCQVVGRKYVRLYPPEAKEAMFPMGKDERGVDMGNTSSIPGRWVDTEDTPEGIDEEEIDKWQRFKSEEGYIEFIVEEGEAVYFPKGWWHFVKSIDASFSVNFWWGGNE